MPKRCLGIVASTDVVTVVQAEVPDDPAMPVTITLDDTWRVQGGVRSAAYAVLHQLCSDHVREHRIDLVVVKASAVPQGAARLPLLKTAEVRGVILAAAGSVCETMEIASGVISRNYGDRRVAEYLADDDFWKAHTTGGSLRKTSREAAMVLIATRDT